MFKKSKRAFMSVIIIVKFGTAKLQHFFIPTKTFYPLQHFGRLG